MEKPILEWGCRKFLKGKVRIVNSDDQCNGVARAEPSTAPANGKRDGDHGSVPTTITKEDQAEIAQL